MRVLYWLYLLFKRQLKNPVITAFIVIMPIAAAIITNVVDTDTDEKPRVGLVVQDDNEITVLTRNYLVEGDYSVEFYMALSEAELEQDIMDGKTECGYVISPNLSDKLRNKDYEGAVELIICKSDFISSMTNEIFFSAMFKAYSPEIAINYVKSVDSYAKHAEKAEENIREGYAEYLAGDETFKINFTVLDEMDESGVTELEESTGDFPLRAILVILVYIAGLFGIVQFYMDSESGAFSTLPKSYRIAGKPLYAFISCALFAVSVEITLMITGEASGAADILKMMIYVLAVTLFSWALAIVVRSSRGMTAVIPVLLVACIILCPLFVNITTFVPFTKYLRALLLPYYMIE